jgi:transcriptional regulator with PAS, ATPase and Fis domain
VVTIRLPPLRERVADIPLFAASFLDHFNRELGKNIAGLRPAVLDALMAHKWPGNIRELRNVIERAVVFCMDDQIGLAHIPREVLDAA